MNVHFSSKSNEWCTPDWLYEKLDDEFHFDLDAAATIENTKCPNFFTEQQDSLNQDWSGRGKTIWLNPPYGRLIGKFVKKAYEESLKGCIVVLLIPARVDTKWWHEYCTKGEVRFIKGRIRFIKVDNKDSNAPAPFPSSIIILGRDVSTSYISYK